MSNIFGTNTTSDLMSVAETAQKIMQGNSLTEDWLEGEMYKVQHKWPKTNPKIKQQWLKKITARAEKEGMDMSAGGEFEERLRDFGLTIHAGDKVWTEASKIKSKWKKMSTAERTRWIDKLDDLARKHNTSEEDVRAIRDEFGLHMSEEVEVSEGIRDFKVGDTVKFVNDDSDFLGQTGKITSLSGNGISQKATVKLDKGGKSITNVLVKVDLIKEEVELGEALKPKDKDVIQAFYDKESLEGRLLSTDGKTLEKLGMGGQTIAVWKNNKIVVTAVSDVKSTDEILRYMKKSIPKLNFDKKSWQEFFEEVELDERHGGWKPGPYNIINVTTGEILQVVKTGTGAKRIADKINFSPKTPDDQMVGVYHVDARNDTTTIRWWKKENGKKVYYGDLKSVNWSKIKPGAKSEEVEVAESIHDKKSTFTMAPFEDLRSVADAALQVMTRNRQEVKEEEVTKEEPPQKLTEEIV